MGQALAEELIRDCADNLRGKSLGIVSCAGDSQAVQERSAGFQEALKGMGTRVSWNVEGIPEDEGPTDYLHGDPKRYPFHKGESGAALYYESVKRGMR